MATIPPITVKVEPEFDQEYVCEFCQAVVADMDGHKAWHANMTDFVQQRARGMEKRVDAIIEQARVLVGNTDTRVTGLNEAFVHDRNDQRGRLEQIEGALGRVEEALPGVYARLRGVEDELSGRVAAPTGEVVRNLSGSMVAAYLDVPDGIYRVQGGQVRPLSVGPELPDGTYTVQGQRVVAVEGS